MIFTCPFSNEQVAHPCPVVGCPSNISRYSKTKSCAAIIDENKYVALAEITKIDVAAIKKAAVQQAARLAEKVKHLDFVNENTETNTCPRCGYVTPCVSMSLCDERHEVAEAILGKLNANGVNNVRATLLWFAAVTKNDAFLSLKQRNALRELVTQPKEKS